MKVSWIKYLIAGIILTGIIIFLAPGIYNGVVNTIPSSGPVQRAGHSLNRDDGILGCLPGHSSGSRPR